MGQADADIWSRIGLLAYINPQKRDSKSLLFNSALDGSLIKSVTLLDFSTAELIRLELVFSHPQ